MYPHERSLVKKLADKPFALVGVNSDDDLDELKKVLAEEKSQKGGGDAENRTGSSSGDLQRARISTP